MATDFRRARINFDPTSGREQRETVTVVFGGRVLKAEAALNGFDVGFTGGDHHVWREKVDTTIDRIDNNTVTVAVNYLYRDSSGHIDDTYSGWVDVLVIANIA